MIKKTFCIGLLFIMVFSLAACDQGLAAYKEDAKQQIENYVEAKGQSNYSDGNWSVVCGIVEAGKQAVDDATNKASVDTAVTTKIAINGVKLNGVIPFQIGVSGIPQHGSSMSTMTKLVREHEGLTSTFDESEIDWENDIAIWERYDADFFENNALILQFFWAHCDSTVYSIETVWVNGETINIDIVGRGATENDSTYLVTLVVEVANSDIADATNIDVETLIEFAK